MTRRIGVQDVRRLKRADEELKALRAVQSENWLKCWYGPRLYGGWERPQDGQIMGPHERSIAFHEADKARFCPFDVRKGVRCHTLLGYAGIDPTASWKCPRCGKESSLFGRRAAVGYRTMFLCGSNRSWKTLNAITCLASWIRGTKVWEPEPSLTSPPGSGRSWGIAGDTFSRAFALVIIPYIRNVLGDMIVREDMTAAKTISCWTLSNGDKLYPMSYTQYTHKGKSSEGSTNPFEGTQWYGFVWDEPMPHGAYTATSRGLTSGRSQGWGREIVAATPLYSPFLWKLYASAACRGGDRPEIFVDEFVIHENTMMTPSEIEEFLSQVPPEERQAREWGRFTNLAGRVYDVFEESVHVIEDSIFDPLVHPDDQGLPKSQQRPSNFPVVHVVDPHDTRPWAMGWYAIGPGNEIYAVREWPNTAWENIRGTQRLGYRDYHNIIQRVEQTLPGGPDRVLWREMDPNKGRTGNTGSYGKSIAESMRDQENGGYYFHTDVSDDIQAGHAAVNEMMRGSWDGKSEPHAMNKPHFFVMKDMRNHRWSISNYIYPYQEDWDTFEKKMPDGPSKDFCDLIRYLCMRQFQFRPWNENTNAFESFNRNLNYGLPGRGGGW